MKWFGLLLLFLTPVMAQAADTTYVEIGRTSTGHVVYFGTDINSSELVFELGYVVQGADTTWSKWLRPIGDPNPNLAGVPRLPFSPPSGPPPTPTTINEQRNAVLANLGANVQARLRRLPARATPLSSTELLRVQLDVLASSELIDSVRVVSDHGYEYKWRGDSDWWVATFAGVNTPLSDGWTFTQELTNILTALDGNALVLIDRGYVKCAGGNVMRRELEADVAAIRAGQSTSQFIPEQAQANLRQPANVRTVIQGGQR